MAKYLDNNGLLYFWQKIKNLFALKSELPDVFTGATSSAAGTEGLVPGPTAGVNKYLNIDGTWKRPNGSEILRDSSSTTGTVAGALSSIESTFGNFSEDITFIHGAIADGLGDSYTPVAINRVYASPASGSAGPAAFRALVAADIPNLSTSKLNSGTLGVARGGTGASTLGAGVVYHASSGTGALSIATAANLVSAIGNSAVNRATADASGNNIADTYAKKTDVTGTYKYKGSVASAANLPSTGQAVGDVYNIESSSTYGSAGTNVAWNGTEWDSLGGVFQIEAITNGEIDTIVAS